MKFELTAQERREFVELAHSPAVRKLAEHMSRRVQSLAQSMDVLEAELDLRWRQGAIRELKCWMDEIEDARKDT